MIYDNKFFCPKSSCEIISERIASSVAIPPAFLITWASPNFNPKISFMDILASIHDNTAIFLAGEASKSPSLNVSAYFSLAGRKSVFKLVIVNKIYLSSNEFFGIFHFKHQYKIKITIEKIAKKVLALLNNFQKHEKQNINNSYTILFTIRFIKIYINQLHVTLSAFKKSLKHTTTKSLSQKSIEL